MMRFHRSIIIIGGMYMRRVHQTGNFPRADRDFDSF